METDSSVESKTLKPYIKRIGLLLPIPILLFYFYTVYHSPLYIIEQDKGLNKKLYQSTCISDLKDGGHTNIQPDNTIKAFGFKYTLKEGVLNPYANVIVSKKDSSFFNLDAYNSIWVKIKASKGQRIPLYLASFSENHTQTNKDISYRYSLNNLNVSPQFREIEIYFHEFYTPDWWYISNHKTELDFKDPDLSKVQKIYIGNCINLPFNEEDKVVVEELSFHVNLFRHVLYAGSMLFVYYGLLVLFLFKKSTARKEAIHFQYETLDSKNHQDTEEEKVFKYLNEFFNQQELSIIDVQNATGIHERKISTHIKNSTQQNFKQYLNALRISAAKKILVETELPISDIAFQVGYSNASTFNRVFKSIENCAPNDYRKQKQGNPTKSE